MEWTWQRRGLQKQETQIEGENVNGDLECKGNFWDGCFERDSEGNKV